MNQSGTLSLESRALNMTYASADTVGHPDLSALVALWQKHRGAAEFPQSGTITPHDMRLFLQRISLFGVVDHGRDFHVRVLGGTMSDGLWLAQSRLLSESEDRILGTIKRLTHHCRRIISKRVPFSVSADLPRIDTINLKSAFEALWLPLGQSGVIEQILVGSVTVADY